VLEFGVGCLSSDDFSPIRIQPSNWDNVMVLDSALGLGLTVVPHDLERCVGLILPVVLIIGDWSFGQSVLVRMETI